MVEQIRAEGAELVVVGSGTVWHAKHFKEERALDFLLLVDPELKAYQAAEMKRGFIRTFSPKSLRSSVAALRDGHRQQLTKGDNFQQGGELVIGAGGTLVYGRLSERTGDHSRPEELLAALREGGA